jgi:hypothetical protein
MRNISDKICGENENAYFKFNNLSENRAIYEINGQRRIVIYDKNVRRTRCSRWITKPTKQTMQGVTGEKFQISGERSLG